MGVMKVDRKRTNLSVERDAEEDSEGPDMLVNPLQMTC